MELAVVAPFSVVFSVGGGVIKLKTSSRSYDDNTKSKSVFHILSGNNIELLIHMSGDILGRISTSNKVE